MEGDQGQKAKQPYAIAMKDGRPFGIGGLWENWKEPPFGRADWDSLRRPIVHQISLANYRCHQTNNEQTNT
jgi:putative SOS response-associated peptidase YedK